MERLLLKCPKELSPFVNATLALSANLISWDPNFAGGDEDDDMAEDEDADEEYDEECVLVDLEPCNRLTSPAQVL